MRFDAAFAPPKADQWIRDAFDNSPHPQATDRPASCDNHAHRHRYGPMDLVKEPARCRKRGAQLQAVVARRTVAQARSLVQCLMNDGVIASCGNGGSAADAQHFAAEP
jgi:hypothetical protein